MKRIYKTRLSARQHSPVNAKVVTPAVSRRVQVGIDVTPAQLRYAIRAARSGEPAKLFSILEQFHQADDEIPAALQTLVASVLAEPYTFVPRDESPEAQRQAEVFDAVFDEMDAVSLFEELLEAHYYGIRPTRLIWDNYSIDNIAYQVPTKWESLPGDFIYAKKQSPNSDYTSLHIGDQPFDEYPHGSVITSMASRLPAYKDIDFTELGVGLGCLRFAIMKYYDIEDWAAFNEAFGTPMILGELTDGWQDNDKKLLEEAVMNLGNDSRGVMSSRGKIHFPDVNKTGSADTYERFYSLLNRIISTKIKSESLTDQMNKHGSNAAMKTAYGVQLNVARSLMRKLHRMVTNHIMKPIANQNFNGRLLCDLVMTVKAVDDLGKQVTIDRGLQQMGVKLSKSQILKRYGRKEAIDEDDELTPSASASLFGGI